MSGLAFAQQTILVVTPGEKVIHGSKQYDWKNPVGEPLAITGCSVQPVQGSEATDGRDATLVQWQALVFDLAKAAQIDETKHIKFGGLEFDIVGPPLPMIFGLTTDHVQILMNVWKG